MGYYRCCATVGNHDISSKHLLNDHKQKRNTDTKENSKDKYEVQLILLEMCFYKFCKRDRNQNIYAKYNADTQRFCNGCIGAKNKILKRGYRNIVNYHSEKKKGHICNGVKG